MSRYRKIECKLWNSNEFSMLSSNTKLVYLHLLSANVSNPVGCYVANLPGLSAELRLDLKTYQASFDTLVQNSLVKYDKDTQVIFLPDFLSYNLPANPNVIKSWEKIINELPECDLKEALFDAFCAMADDVSLACQEQIEILLSKEGKPFRIQEQYQEQYQYKKTKINKIKNKNSSQNEQEQETEKMLSLPEDVFVSFEEQRSQAALDARVILNFLNEKAKRAYRPVSGNLALIEGRLLSGATMQQCKQVICKKVREWKDNEKMREYLRPATLFRASNFEQYLGELVEVNDE